MLECVVNISEGREFSVLSPLVAEVADHFLDIQIDDDHHRTVLTLAGPGIEEAVRRLARRTVEMVNLENHSGVHPRLGALDVVPFVPLYEDGGPVSPEHAETHSSHLFAEALAARDRFASWLAQDLGVPCFCYGPERALPDIRRHAFVDLQPDFGPKKPHPTAGACAVGARPVLVAYNLWLATTDVAIARSIAKEVRSPYIRALGLPVSGTTQVSCNLLDPFVVGPEQAYDAVAEKAVSAGTELIRAELVGLVPRSVLTSVPRGRWAELDLDAYRTIEYRFGQVKRRMQRAREKQSP